MTKNERVIHTANNLNLSGAEFARSIGATRQMFSNWKNNVAPVPDKFIVKIIEKYPNVDARWLVVGEANSPKLKKEVDLSHKQALNLKDQVIKEKERVITLKDEIISLLKNVGK